MGYTVAKQQDGDTIRIIVTTDKGNVVVRHYSIYSSEESINYEMQRAIQEALEKDRY